MADVAGSTPTQRDDSPVQVDTPPITAEADAACPALMSQLPLELAGDPSRRVDSDSPYAYAWGDPATSLVCGVGPARLPAPTPLLLTVNGVVWFVDTSDPTVNVWTTVDRTVAVQSPHPRQHRRRGRHRAEPDRRHRDPGPVTPVRCPCGTGLTHGECCGRLHGGSVAAGTAEQLMRSRYSAFVVGDAGVPAGHLAPGHPAAGPSSWTGTTRWLGLDVLAVEGGGLLAAEGTVEFRASYRAGGRRGAQHERSRFTRLDGRWHYLDGVALP